MASKRLMYLESIVANGTADAFAMYGLALEYKSLGESEKALVAFKALREKHPDYVAMYLMCGQLLEGMGNKEDAREWLTSGITLAKAKRESHALSELETALAALD